MSTRLLRLYAAAAAFALSLVGAMTVTTNARRLVTERHDSYVRFIRAVRYPQGLRSYFLASPILRPGLRVLDAGCGAGALTLAVYEASVRRGAPLASLNAFDITPTMLDQLRARLQRRSIESVELAEADVLRLDTLPPSWVGYDLVVSASMLEYVPRDRFVEALHGLRERLSDSGRLVLFITRRNPLTRIMIGRWWQSNLYTVAELTEAFHQADFTHFAFRQFPLAARYLSMWGHVIEAQR